MTEDDVTYNAADNSRKCYEVAIEACREKLASFRKQTFLDRKATLYSGDCLEVLKLLPGSSVDSVVTDPPYHLTSIVKRFGSKDAAPAQYGVDGAYARASSGFMGKQWDGGDIAFRVELWAEVLRVLKPGGHLVAFSGTRTYHRMACAIEDAGFEIRDQIGWAYGSGFPKSHDVAKSIDKAARGVPHGGADPTSPNHGKFKGGCSEDNARGQGFGAGPGQFMAEAGAKVAREYVTEAKAWDGWGTALKPAWEPICLARKPLIGTVAENVLTHGTGALNIDGCRVPAGDNVRFERAPGNVSRENWRKGTCVGAAIPVDHGRWPANLVHDGSEEVLAAFPEAPGQLRSVGPANGAKDSVNCYGDFGPREQFNPHGDSGSAARFFYTTKADAEDRLGSKHPTVKPLDLMQWLVRLVTPKGGTVLDPFAGTGTTGEAAWREGMRAILIEREAEYQADIARRMELAVQPTKRAAVAASKNNLQRPEDLPLFATEGA